MRRGGQPSRDSAEDIGDSGRKSRSRSQASQASQASQRPTISRSRSRSNDVPPDDQEQNESGNEADRTILPLFADTDHLTRGEFTNFVTEQKTQMEGIESHVVSNTKTLETLTQAHKDLRTDIHNFTKEASDRNDKFMERLLNNTIGGDRWIAPPGPVDNSRPLGTAFGAPSQQGINAIRKAEYKYARKKIAVIRKSGTHKSRKENGLKYDVREYVLELLGRKNEQDKTPFPDPPPATRIQRFMKDGSGGPSMEYFRIDFSRSSMVSEWNHDLSYVFASAYASQTRFIQGDREDVASSFRTYLKTLKIHYETQNNEGRRTERHVEALNRNGRNTRRKKLYDFRITGGYFSEQQQNQEFFSVLQTVNHQCMSEDERVSGDEEELPPASVEDEITPTRKYKILDLKWRSAEFRRYLRLLDLLYLQTKFDEDGRPDGGAWVRNRKPCNEYSDSKPVGGLPSNFYDEYWYKNLDDITQKLLKAKPAIDITIPDGLKKLAARYYTNKKEKLPRSQEAVNADMATFEEWLSSL